MKLLLLTTLLVITTLTSKAQFNKAELIANGLTCSMCSFATQKQLKTIDFIDSIGTDLNHTTFILYFKKDAEINSDLIKKKVEDAGFAVGSLVYTTTFSNNALDNGNHYNYKSTAYHFAKVDNTLLNGTIKIKIIDKGFVSDKEFKKYKKLADTHTTLPVTTNTAINKVYHVLLQ
jgi:copper chaperone CopZ